MDDNKELALKNHEMTEDQVALIKKTIAKNATDDELRLFLYQCKRLGLDPLSKQIHFVKYGNSPGTVITGIDGFRLVAHRTGKLSGIKRGAIRNDNGVLVGGWAEVYRSDWTHPAREEVPLAEYNKGSGNWKTMPETMIKKVAEAAALRMAFPSDLSGIYSDDEMDQATPVKDVSTKPQTAHITPPNAAVTDGVLTTKAVKVPAADNPVAKPAVIEQGPFAGDYVINFGNWEVGKALKNIDPTKLEEYILFLEAEAKKRGKTITGPMAAFIQQASYYLNTIYTADDDSLPPF